MGDRARLILTGLITAAICAVMIYASYFHLSL
jgi:hypothetical protein